MQSQKRATRNLILILGDQCDRQSATLDDLDAQSDIIVMIEVAEESRVVPSHKQRTALFFSVMRHHAEWLQAQGFRLHYSRITDPDNQQSFTKELLRLLKQLTPKQVICILPGEFRVEAEIRAACASASVPLEIRPDRHFFVTPEDFAKFRGTKNIRMEHFYRWQRREQRVLLDDAGEPEGGRWNYDAENRESLKGASDYMPAPLRFPPDAITQQAILDVETLFPDNPGSTQSFAWPVTPDDAEQALDDFVLHRLASFGRFQDAMLTGQPFLYHSLISPALNLKLISPRTVVQRVESEYRQGRVPLSSAEGFIRQILGWREFIRGIYFAQGPNYRTTNALDAKAHLPPFFWTAKSGMACMDDCIGQTLEHGYAHHIQRLMVTGNFALIAGIQPVQVDDWYLAVYVDATDWVSLPNTHGMVLHADGGVVGSKPYAASGRYIDRMSNYCKSCQYNPTQRTGETACPFSVFYWDFLMKHEARFRRNPRISTILGNLKRMSPEEKANIINHANTLRTQLGMTKVD